jgi:hypothetical protein
VEAIKERIDNRINQIMSEEEMQLKGTGSFIQTSVGEDGLDEELKK